MPGAVAQGKFGKQSVVLALLAFAAGAIAITSLVAARPNDSRSIGLLGIVLNSLSVLAGLGILTATASTIGAFA